MFSFLHKTSLIMAPCKLNKVRNATTRCFRGRGMLYGNAGGRAASACCIGRHAARNAGTYTITSLPVYVFYVERVGVGAGWGPPAERPLLTSAG